MTSENVWLWMAILILVLIFLLYLARVILNRTGASIQQDTSPDRLQPIRWLDEHLEFDIAQRIVHIGPHKVRILTATPDHAPGSFGVRMRVGEQATVQVKNELGSLFGPADDCKCDIQFAMMPMTNTNPCWTNLHFHGFWGSANQDNVYACVKPGEHRMYRYDLNPRHPTGLYIAHVHNFSSSVTQDHITPFIIDVVNPNNRSVYPRHIRQIDLFLILAYMQSTLPSVDPDGCDMESFDFPKYASGDFTTYTTLLRAGPKLLLTNGQIEPWETARAGEPVIFRIGWMGILDVMRFRVVDDQDQPIEYRMLAIDALPIAGQCNSRKASNVQLMTEFLAAHMQRFEVMVIFPKPGQYRLQKYTTVEDEKSPFTVPTKTVLHVKVRPAKEQYEQIDQLRLENPFWVRYVNRHFRNLVNLAAWRTVRFNYPSFPLIEGSMFDLNVQPAQVVMAANRSEVWLVGSHEGLHSLHIHLQWFLIMAHRDKDTDPWTMIPKEQQWFQDTLTLESGHQFLVWMFPFADARVHRRDRATGLAMVHCHMSDHTDSMMMLSLLVSDDPTVQPSGVGLVMGAQSPEILDITTRSSCIGDCE